MSGCISNPAFSIITAVFNGERTLGEAIRSVLSQVEASWEHIIVDDGSTDNTAAVVHSFDDVRIRYCVQPRQGRSAARNSGMRLAVGEYLLFLDADDWLLPNALSDHLSFFRLHPEFGMSISDGSFCTENGEELVRFSARRGAIRSGQLFKRIVVDPGVVGAPLCAAVRREIVARHKIQFDERIEIGEDWLFWVQVASRAEIGVLEVLTCRYRWYRGSTTLRASEEFRNHQLWLCRRQILNLSSFQSLPEPIRSHFYYQVLLESLKGKRAVQWAVVRTDSFKRLSTETRARLLRLVAIQYLLSGSRHSTSAVFLRASRRQSPHSVKTLVLVFLFAAGPALARTAAAVWQRLRYRAPLPAPDRYSRRGRFDWKSGSHSELPSLQ